jgi:hypothetical protein
MMTRNLKIVMKMRKIGRSRRNRAARLRKLVTVMRNSAHETGFGHDVKQSPLSEILNDEIPEARRAARSSAAKDRVLCAKIACATAPDKGAT